MHNTCGECLKKESQWTKHFRKGNVFAEFGQEGPWILLTVVDIPAANKLADKWANCPHYDR